MEGAVLYVVTAVLGAVGVLVHFYKKKLTDPSFQNLKRYVLSHSVYSIMAITATVAGALGYAHEIGSVPLDATILAYATKAIGFGFICDSLINKYMGES